MLGWLLLALPLLLILLALVVPIDLTIDARLDERGLRQRTHVQWLFVRKEIARRERAPTEMKARKRRNGLAMLRTDGFVEAIHRLVRRIVRSARLTLLKLRVAFGFEDPATTGMLMGFVAPLSVLVPLPSNADIRLEPDLDRERLDGELHARVRLWPFLAVAALVAFALTPVTWRALRAGRRA